MATKNLIPRASEEGKLGVRGDTNYLWKEVNAVSGSFDQIDNNNGNSLLNAGAGVTINHVSGSDGFQYTIAATATSISSINDINDVNATSVSDGQYLVWNNSGNIWEPATPTTGDITSVLAGTGLSGGGASGDVTLNVSGLTVSELAAGSLQLSSESFVDDDTSLMTSAAIDDLIVSKGYTVQSDIDAAVQGLDVKDSVRAATTAVLTGLTYDNSTQQWQEGTSTGALSIDGVVLVDNDRVLVKDAAAATQNGIYVVSGIDGSSQVVLDRAEDLDNGSDFRGVFTFVEEGTTNVTRGFVAKNTSNPSITTVGSNTQNWSQFSSAGSVSALDDLSDVSFTAGSGIDNYVLTYDHASTSWGAEAVPAVGIATSSSSGIIEIASDTEAAAATAADKALVPSNIASLDLSSMDNTTSGFIANVVSDTTPQLGGSLDVNGELITSVSNGDIEVDPNGNGSFKIRGNATSGSGRLVLNCEQNTHGITLKGPPHGAGANYTLTLPDNDGNANQVLQTNGSGVLSWASPAAGISSVLEDTTPQLGGDLNIWNGSSAKKIYSSNGHIDIQANHQNGRIRFLSEDYTPLRINADKYGANEWSESHIIMNGNVSVFPYNNDALSNGDMPDYTMTEHSSSQVSFMLGSLKKARLAFGRTGFNTGAVNLQNTNNSHTLQLYTSESATDDSPTFEIYASATSNSNSGELQFSRNQSRFGTGTTTIGEVSGKSSNSTEYVRMQLKSTNGEGAFNFDVRTGSSLTTALEVYSNASNNNIVKVNEHDGITQGLMLGTTLVTAIASEINLLDASAASGASNGDVLTYNTGVIAWAPASGGGASRPSVTTVTTQTSVPSPASTDVLESVFIYNSSNVITTTLPDITTTAAITAGFKYQLKNINTGAVTINAASGEHIDYSGQTSVTINQYDSYTLTTDGANWFII